MTLVLVPLRFRKKLPAPPLIDESNPGDACLLSACLGKGAF